jgi:hypothetical protein
MYLTFFHDTIIAERDWNCKTVLGREVLVLSEAGEDTPPCRRQEFSLIICHCEERRDKAI